MCNITKKELCDISVSDMEQVISKVFLELTGVDHEISVDELTLRKARSGNVALEFTANIGRDKAGW